MPVTAVQLAELAETGFELKPDHVVALCKDKATNKMVLNTELEQAMHCCAENQKAEDKSHKKQVGRHSIRARANFAGRSSHDCPEVHESSLRAQ